MAYIKIDPMDYPMAIGESWWVIHPNDSEAQIDIPIGAPAVCTQNFQELFVKNSPYRIVNVDDCKGSVTVESPENGMVEMPRYIFARYFDTVAFIRRREAMRGDDE